MKDSKGLSFEEHMAYGAEVQRSAAFFERSLDFLTQRYGHAPYCAKKMAEIVKGIEEFRYEMDELVLAEHKGQPNPHDAYYQASFDDAEQWKTQKAAYPVPNIPSKS